MFFQTRKFPIFMAITILALVAFVTASAIPHVAIPSPTLAAPIGTINGTITTPNGVVIKLNATFKAPTTTPTTGSDSMSASPPIPVVVVAILVSILALALLMALPFSYFSGYWTKSPEPCASPPSNRQSIDGPEIIWERAQHLDGERNSRVRFAEDMQRQYSPRSTDDDDDDDDDHDGEDHGDDGDDDHGDDDLQNLIQPGNAREEGESIEMHGLSGGDSEITIPRAAMVRSGFGTPKENRTPVTKALATQN